MITPIKMRHLILVLILPPFVLALSSTNCYHSVTIITGQNSCNRIDKLDSNQWQCPDLQSALQTAARVLNSSLDGDSFEVEQNSSNCVSIAVPPGDHMVTAPLYFSSTNLYIFGTGEVSDDVTIFCSYTVDVNESRIFDPDYDYIDYTFYFNRSQLVSLEKLQFVGCPYPLRMDTIATVGVSNSTFRNFTEAVFDIFNSANVSITDSTFVDNSGTGISRHSFRANTGAVAIGYNNIPTSFQMISLEVSQCNFTNNRATAISMFRSTNSAFFSRIFTGRGGALGVFYNESFYDITTRIYDNHFENNYARSFGGGVFLVMFGDGIQVLNMLERNTFVNNFATLGAGAVLSTFISNGVVGRPHSTIITDCTFNGNRGQSGGAIFVYQAYELFGVSFVRCERCNFTNNTGINSRDDYGAAVGIYLVNQFGSIEAAQKYEFIDCTFEQNNGNNGIFAIAYSPLSFSGTNKFIGNTGSDALRIIGSLVDFKGEVQFINNTQDNAVAMHLLSFGQARVFSGLQMIFWGSSGTFGASIQVDSQTSSVAFSQLAYNPQCFAVHENPSLSPDQWNDVSVSFQKNKAVLGSSLFISRLESCSWISTDADPAFNNTFLFEWPIWDYGNDSINTGYLDSYNSGHSVVTTVHTISTAYKSVRAWPGQRFLIKLAGLDQFSHLTTANARLTFSSAFQGLMVNFNPQIVVIDVVETLAEDFTVTYSISSGDALTISGALGTVTIDEPIQNIVVKPARFTLYSLPCPAGYDLVSAGQQLGGLECQCEQNNKLIINCEDDQDSIIVEEGYWGSAVLANTTGYRYDLFLHPCPPGYCRCSQNTSLGSSSCAFTYTNSDPDAQCVCNRQGIFCGDCRRGMGVSALLNNCVSCHNAQGLLILALIVADAIAFIVIVVADMSLPGWVYPFIFYVQVVPSVAIYFPESFIKGGKFLHFVSSALGFYFVYDFCLYSNMSPLVSYFIRYLPIIVALLLLPAVFVLRKKKRMVLQHHGIWSIILLLYSHLVHTSMSILECPFIPNYSFPRWFVNGNIGCFTGWHAPLALLAIAVLVIAIVLIPFIALVSMKQHLIKRLYWLKYIEAPLTVIYKEEWRWWSAVELARRFIFILFVIPFPRNSIPPLIIMCIMLVVYGLIQPYKSQIDNVVEMVVQTNFIVLLALESTSGLNDIFSVFSEPTIPASVSSNVTNVCSDGLPGVSIFTIILLPFYYAPLLFFVVMAIVNIILYIRNKKSTIRESLHRRSTKRYSTRTAANVTKTEVGFDHSYELSGDHNIITSSL